MQIIQHLDRDTNDIVEALEYLTEQGKLHAKEIARNTSVYFLPLAFHLKKPESVSSQAGDPDEESKHSDKYLDHAELLQVLHDPLTRIKAQQEALR